MVALSYRPGDWLGIVRSGIAVVLPPGSDHAAVERIWNSLQEARGVPAALGALTTALGADITALPSFAILGLSREMHVLLRGPLVLNCRAVDGTETQVSGERVATWSERLLADQQRLALALGTPASGDGVRLPLLEGVVRLSGLEVSLGTAAGGEAAPALGPAPLPTPVPERAPAPRAAAVPAPVAEPEPGSWTEDTIAPGEDLDRTIIPEPSPALATEAAPERAPAPAPRVEPVAPATPATAPSLIDAVPWLRRATPGPESTPAPGSEPGPAPEPAGDHDGDTILRSELPSAAAAPAPAGAGPLPTGPVVLAKACLRGHANPPVAAACFVCGSTLEETPHQMKRPALGSIVLSTGERIGLDRSVIVGRQPAVARVQGSGMPRLVQVPSASGDISRSHLQIALDGWHVLVSDLKSTNGTVLVRHGQPPRRLGHGETAMILDGDVVDLGDNVTVRFEGVP
ncbi:FHA domain-containing protein [Paenarthrobacter sp. DKR-5]|uniref:FHA domain-containing protein n=1 Tax=Paenarthrobacter sp. DKR-5 TaxID=2835535 RepID=UPI001BDCE59D|nr:FHA domain-containing protein [Paenarthrobacter sp. DKR-5]MBT1002534.1 FHA domain-containing protein [Paenarthrobacter sp. DKR-5]